MKVLGMGNALVDIIIHLSDDKLLEELNLPKASMQLIDTIRLKDIHQRLEGVDKELSSGGSAANTIHGLASLGVETGFLGSIGKDEYGSFFEEDMKSKGVKPVFNYSKSPSGRATAFVSPDSERTFATFWEHRWSYPLSILLRHCLKDISSCILRVIWFRIMP